MANEMQGYEDVTIYELSPEREQELITKQIECNFIWSNKSGHGVGVIMNYVARDGRIWLTATEQRALACRVTTSRPYSAVRRRTCVEGTYTTSTA